MSARIPATLFAVALGLAGVVVYQLAAPIAPIDDPPAQPPATHAAPAAPARFVPPPAAQFAVIDERPLFDPNRQPVSEPDPVDATVQAAPPDLSLVGIAIGGGSSIALVKPASATAAVSVMLGQSIAGWQVARIAPDSVVLRSGGREFTVRMRQAKGLPQPTLNNVPPPPVTGPAGH